MSEVKKLIAEARGYQGQDEYGLVDLAHRLADALEALDSAPVVARPLPDREALIEVAEGVDIIREKGETRTYPTRILDAVLAALDSAPPVSDDTEWEYAVRFKFEDGRLGRIMGLFALYDDAEHFASFAAADETRAVVRRRRAGPWVAIEKGGESNE